MLSQQLKLLDGVAFSADKDEINQLDELWADNGDALAMQYAGTGALRADITRTGKRQLFGYYNDGYNAMTRYYLNNV